MTDRRKLLVVVGGSLAGTATILVLVFSLSGWAYRHRGLTLHDGRLRRAVEQHPTAAQITEGLLAEPGNRALPTPASEAELRRLVAQWPAAPVDEILARRRTFPDLRVFAVRDVAYFLFFDKDGKLQDYVLVTR